MCTVNSVIFRMCLDDSNVNYVSVRLRIVSSVSERLCTVKFRSIPFIKRWLHCISVRYCTMYIR